jgi:choline/glycine/proline betaine transport protein
VAVVTVAIFVTAAALQIGAASEVLIAAKDWVVGHFDWLFVLVATACVVLVAGVAIHPHANARLGPEDSRPEFGRLSWFAMLFSAGLASGLLYWATAEPILHQQGNPFLAAAGDDADAGVRTAMRLTVMHWGLHGWALYVVAGLGIGLYSHRHDRTLSFRSALAPVLGTHVDRWPGLAVDLIAVFGTVCGVATSIGISAGATRSSSSSASACSASCRRSRGSRAGSGASPSSTSGPAAGCCSRSCCWGPRSSSPACSSRR